MSDRIKNKPVREVIEVTVEKPVRSATRTEAVGARAAATADKVRGVVEILDEKAKRSALLGELYDKVNIAYFFFQNEVGKRFSDKEVPVFFDNYVRARKSILKRYLRYLVQERAEARDIAKAICLWRGSVNPDDIDAAMEEAAILLKELQKGNENVTLPVPPDNRMQWADENFGSHCRHQIGDFRPAVLAQHQEWSLRKGQAGVFEVYQHLKNYLSEDYGENGRLVPEDRNGLIRRSAEELAELHGDYEDYDKVPQILFQKVAAILLRVVKSSYVNILDDSLVSLLCRMVIRGNGADGLEVLVRRIVTHSV